MFNTWRMRQRWISTHSVLLLCCCLLLPASVLCASEDSALFAPDGYRIDQFRAPVPDRVDGGETIHAEQLQRLLTDEPETVLIDVLPAPPKPKGLAPTALWLPPPRFNIPGSTWLPNVGYGRISDELEHYFRDNLERLTGGSRDRPVVIYCLADCWMSWNATRRAAGYGYRRLYWFPDGSDGWESAGHSLAKSRPVPLPGAG